MGVQAADIHTEDQHRRRLDRRWWIALIVVVVGSFAVLLGMGVQLNNEKPPLPQAVVAGNDPVMTIDDIQAGQRIWQSMGGQEIGSVWGHGAYVAPDWTADWLHREATFLLDRWSQADYGVAYEDADAVQQGALEAQLTQTLRTNTYDEATGTVTIDADRVAAWEANSAYYTALFADGHERYAIPAGTLTDPAQAQQMADFFWWTSWAASTDRPGTDVTYTQNWPHEPLIGNTPPRTTSSGASSASSCCWPGSPEWSTTTPA